MRAQTKTKWGDRQARRKDILDAARRLLESRGYRALNMRDVAKRAGVTAGTVYTYFASKEALFATLYAERLDRFNVEIAERCATARSPEELFVTVANEYRDVYRVFGRELDLFALMLESGRARRQVAQPLFEAATRVLTTVQAAVGRFSVPPLAVPLVWATLTGLCEHFSGTRHLLHPYSWDDLTRFAARTLALGLARKER